MFKKKNPITKTTFNEYFKEVVSIKESLNTNKTLAISTFKYMAIIMVVSFVGSFSAVLVAALGELAFMPLFLIAILGAISLLCFVNFLSKKLEFDAIIKMFKTFITETGMNNFNLFDENTWPVGDDVFNTIKELSLSDTYEIHTALSEAGKNPNGRKPKHPPKIPDIDPDI